MSIRCRVTSCHFITLVQHSGSTEISYVWIHLIIYEHVVWF
jgi:hypothetical protein